ncbi:MAG: sodium:solute symporter family protein [Elusimicrobiota bacterium]
MTALDFSIFAIYMAVVMGIGIHFYGKNKDAEDYYVGGRSVPASHVGLSIVATDVGGGFSIGLGGLGYAMGLSGSWLLFTGLLGAWLSAVFLIPRIKAIDVKEKLMTYPDFLRIRYDGRVALAAAVISGVGYLGFTGAQILAGAKLMTGTVMPVSPFGMDPLQLSLWVIGAIIIVYTVLGGLKAVIYTDTLQWIVLLSGLIFLAVPLAVRHIGGLAALRAAVPPAHFSLTNIGPVKFFNWMVTIVPIWVVGMTLYQRMYACRGVEEAKKAWYIAGVFEYPVMAFTGVFLGICARALFANVDAEMALPMLLKTVLPAGITGIVVASYYSAIMSTADSCLMAASGNLVNDVLERWRGRRFSAKTGIRVSQAGTLFIGFVAILLASLFNSVLSAILYAYAFMVAGLLVPTLGAYFWKKRSTTGALAGMFTGGTMALGLILTGARPPLGLDPAFWGILASGTVFVPASLLFPDAVNHKASEASP